MENEGTRELPEILKIRRDKLAELKENGKNPYEIVSYQVNVYTKEISDNFENLEGQEVSLAGRMMSRRDMGKASFIDLNDTKGRLQIYIKQDDVGEDVYEDFKKWDIGDIVGINGKVFRTRRGEISVHAAGILLLSKSLLPLPEKWHGLKDQELRYRQRYVDLIANSDVRETFVKRSKIISHIRKFLEKRGFLEVETPVLQTMTGGAAARPFITHHNALNLDMFLRIALELHLKRLIVGGFDKVFEIGRVFRNEGISVRHNPEFTLLELYQAYTDVEGMMCLTEDMFRQTALAVTGSAVVEFGNDTIDMEKPFERLSMKEAVLKYAGVDFDKIENDDGARQLASSRGIECTPSDRKGDILNLIFEKYCEHNLIQPTFITGHPVEISPFAKKSADNPDYTERFELFIQGREYANAFSEINDPIDQRERLEEQLKRKLAGDEEAGDVDEDFLTALEHGMPPTGGLGIGIDRLVMLLTNSSSIRDVLFFPTMRPQA